PQYGTPMDFKGMGSTVLDFRGQPLFTWVDRQNGAFSGYDRDSDGVLQASEVAAMLINEPTQINLAESALGSSGRYDAGSGRSSSVDAPFGVEELEWIL